MRYKRKDILLFVGVFAVVLLAVGIGWFMQTDEPFCLTVAYEGEGTEANPYEVENVRQLQCITGQGLSANYVQVSDIDASRTSEWNDGNRFRPISRFNGTFDGNGYNITNLTIRRTMNSGGSDVNDVTDVKEIGLFGEVENAGIVTNVSVIDADIKGVTRVGGLVGVNKGTISESHATGSVEGSSSVGGLVGFNWGAVSNSYAMASVKGSLVVGGLAGENHGTVKQSYATGTVTGSDGVGGLIGSNSGRTVSDSYATGSVEGDEDVGALIGFNGDSTVKTSYATGSVEGNEDVGGLIGFERGGTAVSDSYWDTEATGQSTSAGGTGLNTSEMISSAARTNMTGFDFTSTWETVSGDYPVLSWRAEKDIRD